MICGVGKTWETNLLHAFGVPDMARSRISGHTSELQPNSAPGAPWGARRVERGVLQRKFPVDCREGARDERCRFGKAGYSKLRSRVVLAVKQVADLREE